MIINTFLKITLLLTWDLSGYVLERISEPRHTGLKLNKHV